MALLLSPNAGTARGPGRQDLPASGPQFADYPVRNIFKGKPAQVQIKTAAARRFRTRLKDDSRQGPNFAGHYTVVFWGCGSGCAELAIVDAITGKVFWLPLDEIDIPDGPQVKPNRNFRLDSKLLIITRAQYDGRGTFTAYYYILDNQRLRLIKQARIDNSTQ